ncbi:MAG: hypothetical protein ACHQUC_01485 [Chlamydiales bacterium]
MNLLINCPPYFGYHFGMQYFAFRQDKNEIIAEVGSLTSTRRITAKLAESIFKHTLSLDLQNQTKREIIAKLLTEGCIPRLKGERVKFHHPRVCSSPIVPLLSHQVNKRTFREKEQLEYAVKCCDLAIKKIELQIKNENQSNPTIPLLSTMGGQPLETKDESRAEWYIQLGKELAENNEFENALEMVSRALAFTQSTSHYSEVPKYYRGMGETLKALLAYLYLTRSQLVEGDFEKAEHTINSAIQFAPRETILHGVFAAKLMMQGKWKEAATLFSSLSDELLSIEMRPESSSSTCTSEESSAQDQTSTGDLNRWKIAKKYLEFAIFCDPLSPLLYLKAAERDPASAQIYLYVKGMLHFNTILPEDSRLLYLRATELFPDQPLLHLARLSIIGNENPESYSLHRKVASLVDDQALVRTHLSLAAESGKEEDLRAYLNHLKQAGDLEEVRELYLNWIADLSTPSEELIIEAIEAVGKNAPLLEQLIKIYRESQHPSLPSLLNELGAIYEELKEESEAERVYTLANEIFNTFETRIKKTVHLVKTGRKKCVKELLELAIIAQTEERYDQLSLCLKVIQNVQSQKNVLSPSDNIKFHMLLTISNSKLFEKNREIELAISIIQDEMIMDNSQAEREMLAIEKDAKETSLPLQTEIVQLKGEISKAKKALEEKIASQEKEIREKEERILAKRKWLEGKGVYSFHIK